MNPRPLIQTILSQYQLPVYGIHGVSHWARVLENGLRLAEQNGADPEVVYLFALFHDSRRRNESVDFGHGQRGAELAAQLRGKLFDLPNPAFDQLMEACARHTDGKTQADLTVQTCWDSDRLDLYRVGIFPKAKYLCTDAARNPEMIQWANERARQRLIPALVAEEWGLNHFEHSSS